MMIEAELFQGKQVFNIFQVTGDEVVHAHHFITFFDKPVTKMGSEKAGRAGNKYSFHSLLFIRFKGYTVTF